MTRISVAREEVAFLLHQKQTKEENREWVKEMGRILCWCFHIYLGMILLLENNSKILLIDFLPGRQAILFFWPQHVACGILVP